MQIFKGFRVRRTCGRVVGVSNGQYVKEERGGFPSGAGIGKRRGGRGVGGPREGGGT